MEKRIRRVQAVLKFVTAWLLALYLFDVVTEGLHWAGGASTVIGAIIVNVYARKKAAATVKTTPMFFVWLYLPVFVLFVLPVFFKVVLFATSEETTSWWQHAVTLLPFVLKLGVPVGALIWAYVLLGRMAKAEPASAQENGGQGLPHS